MGLKNKLFILGVLLIATLCLTPYQLEAANSVDSVSGTWTSVTGGSNVNGVGTNQVNWGYPATYHGQSGYLFTPSSTPFSVSIDTPFTLGQFTHINQPIYGSAVTAARLETEVDLTINDQIFNNLHFIYDFLHNETPNVLPCASGSSSICDDIVKATNNIALSEIFNIDGVDYTLSVLGFQVDGQQFEEFMTQEGKSNTADLIGVVTRADVSVPEPATYLMLGTTLLMALAIASRKKKKATA